MSMIFLEDAKKCNEDASNKWTQDGASSSETCTEEKCPGE